LRIETDCPHCKKPLGIDTEKMNVTDLVKPAEKVNASNQVLAQEQKPAEIKEVEVIKAVSPNDQPFFACKNGDCGDLHKNPNYSKLPDKKCRNCDTLNGTKQCKNCGNKDPEEFEDIEKDDLTELGIPEPKEHEHTHEE